MAKTLKEVKELTIQKWEECFGVKITEIFKPEGVEHIYDERTTLLEVISMLTNAADACADYIGVKKMEALLKGQGFESNGVIVATSIEEACEKLKQKLTRDVKKPEEAVTPPTLKSIFEDKIPDSIPTYPQKKAARVTFVVEDIGNSDVETENFNKLIDAIKKAAYAYGMKATIQDVNPVKLHVK
jgi:hypothetical protein